MSNQSKLRKLHNYINAIDGIRENIVNVRKAHRFVGSTPNRVKGYDETLEQIEDLTESLLAEIEEDLSELQ